MASKKKTTVATHTQDTITQQELIELRILQVQLAEVSASCQRRESDLARKLGGSAVVEPGRFSLAGTSVEVRA